MRKEEGKELEKRREKYTSRKLPSADSSSRYLGRRSWEAGTQFRFPM